MTKTYSNKGALTKWLNRQDQDEESLVASTDSTRTYIIKGEESRCSIWVDIPSRVVNTTYTDNRLWVKQSAWDRIVNFVCNPFDNIWSLAMLAIILGLAYLLYTKYKDQISEAVEEAEEN